MKKILTGIFLLTFLLITLLPVSAQTADEWLLKGEEAYGLEDFSKALDCFEKASVADPDSVTALINKSIVLCAKYQLENWTEDKYREGRECLSKILKIDPYLKKTYVNNVYLDDMTLLHMASYYGHKDFADLLIYRGANVNAKGIRGITPLFMSIYFATFAHMYTHVPAVFEANVNNISSLLIYSGADVNITFLGERTPLHAAAFTGDLELIDLLVSCGADVNARNIDGKTPLHTASDYGNVKTAELLLSFGADINSKNNKGQTLSLI